MIIEHDFISNLVVMVNYFIMFAYIIFVGLMEAAWPPRVTHSVAIAM